MTRLHPLTVLVRGGSRGLSFATFAFFAASAGGPAVGMAGMAALAGPLAAVGLLVGLGYEFARVRRFEYELTADTLDIRSGVFARREREIPLRRVQNVDVSRDLLGRVLGLATVNVETAGGGETEAKLQYVSPGTAADLQEGIRRRKRARTGTPAGTDDTDTGAGVRVPEPGPETGTAADVAETEPGGPRPTPEDRRETLFELDDRSLLLVSLFSFDLRTLSVLFVAGPVLAPTVRGVVDGVGGPGGPAPLVVGVALALLVGVALWLVSAAGTFVQYYGFRLARVGDELRYERGLVGRYDGSIPVDKIQRLSVEENVPMRRFGYAALAVETAGYAPGSGPSGGSEAAVPLAPREEVLALADDIEPFELPAFERPPERARRRYAVRYALAGLALTGVALGTDALLVPLPWYLPLALLPVAPVAARAKHRHRGRALTGEHVFTRNGFWSRTTTVVPYYRVQTVIERRTVFQRRWGLASVVVDTAGTRSIAGDEAVAADVDDGDARAFAREVAERFQAALVRRRAGPGDANDRSGGLPGDGGGDGDGDLPAAD